MSEIIDKRFQNAVLAKYNGDWCEIISYNYGGAMVEIRAKSKYGNIFIERSVPLEEIKEVLDYNEHKFVVNDKLKLITNKRLLNLLSTRKFNIGDRCIDPQHNIRFTIDRLEFNNAGWKYGYANTKTCVFYEDEIELIYNYELLKWELNNLKIEKTTTNQMNITAQNYATETAKLDLSQLSKEQQNFHALIMPHIVRFDKDISQDRNKEAQAKLSAYYNFLSVKLQGNSSSKEEDEKLKLFQFRKRKQLQLALAANAIK